MVHRIYPAELQLNKHDSSDTKAPFLDFYISICNGIVSTKIYDKQDDFDFDKENVPFLNGEIPQRPSSKHFVAECMPSFNPIMVDSYSELFSCMAVV